MLGKTSKSHTAGGRNYYFLERIVLCASAGPKHVPLGPRWGDLWVVVKVRLPARGSYSCNTPAGESEICKYPSEWGSLKLLPWSEETNNRLYGLYWRQPAQSSSVPELSSLALLQHWRSLVSRGRDRQTHFLTHRSVRKIHYPLGEKSKVLDCFIIPI